MTDGKLLNAKTLTPDTKLTLRMWSKVGSREVMPDMMSLDYCTGTLLECVTWFRTKAEPEGRWALWLFGMDELGKKGPVWVVDTKLVERLGVSGFIAKLAGATLSKF